ncbi:MAG: hypothetical protein E6700_04535 [Winkia neuii]|uniref:hypothetical protein n=1 Tax=Winkia neuii TaxID=33007 RepID=UPI0003F5F829|nr:hypothetical protein [Winkia neuii]OFJ71161.1 hypothetical protein HMPREF2851_08265 [Actinomyces sp. HMSC064C12]OFK03825.1 hypothetical protein HMPREF2835_04695 [Actinomyces sp. HMSC072A03]OFT55993.1 hypothetical protein HMPREF3152_02965 [Actinomyces sp. HMSC06A08]MDK8100298.1 hypothetical protein [Winkia neuii]MDU3134827.1 hypothetical protein [Winkia neuii]
MFERLDPDREIPQLYVIDEEVSVSRAGEPNFFAPVVQLWISPADGELSGLSALACRTFHLDVPSDGAGGAYHKFAPATLAGFRYRETFGHSLGSA